MPRELFLHDSFDYVKPTRHSEATSAWSRGAQLQFELVTDLKSTYMMDAEVTGAWSFPFPTDFKGKP
jgi:hypothetical protein